MENESSYNNLKSEIIISNRKTLNITGINKILSFDNEEFLLETCYGKLGVKGKKLDIVKLDTYEGKITITGIINGLSYLDVTKKNKEDTMISKLFK